MKTKLQTVGAEPFRALAKALGTPFGFFAPVLFLTPRGTWARGGAQNPLQTSSSHLSPGKRCGATAQSALGWYRPSVEVPETLDGKPSGVRV